MHQMGNIAILLMIMYCYGSHEMRRLCTCNEVQPCKEKIINSVQPCANKCQRNAEEAGADYTLLRDCILQYKPQILETIECVSAQFIDMCSSTPTEMEVPKRYAIGLELAFMEEINSVLTIAGVHDEVTQFIAHGRRFRQCVQECVEIETNRCSETDSCALNLPSDNAIVRTVKNCAIRSGVLTTPVVQSICECAVNAGLSSLATVCPKLIIQ